MPRQNHEIRTPLVGMLGLSDLLLCDHSLSPTSAAHINTMRSSSSALLHVINSIVDMAVLAHGHVDMNVGVRPRSPPAPLSRFRWRSGGAHERPG